MSADNSGDGGHRTHQDLSQVSGEWKVDLQIHKILRLCTDMFCFRVFFLAVEPDFVFPKGQN